MSNTRKKFGKIYDKYVEKIYRFIFIKVSSKEVAEDLTSETFIRTWKSFEKGHEIKNPNAFIYRIAKNLTVDFYREKAKSPVISEDILQGAIDPESGQEEKLQLSGDIEQVKKSLANIKDEYQDVIVWRYLDGLSVPEISQILDKSEDAVRVTIHRALKALKEEIKA